jgi:DNA invertase Pin-like site-specific DNA recombinase
MSLDAQESRIRAWCEAQDAELVETIRDEGVSGTKLLSERPGGRNVAHLLDSRRPSADAVVVVRMDRLGRDAAEQIALLKRFRSGKWALWPSLSRSISPLLMAGPWPKSVPSSMSLKEH